MSTNKLIFLGIIAGCLTLLVALGAIAPKDTMSVINVIIPFIGM